MTGPRRWVRAGLVALTLLNLTLATWILLAPRNFYGLAAVNLNMPYNEHLLQDFGAMSLALALVLGAAARSMDHRLRTTALQSALLFWAVHFVIHLRHLHAMTPVNTTLLMTALAVTVALPAALLAMSRRASATVRQPGQPRIAYEDSTADGA